MRSDASRKSMKNFSTAMHVRILSNVENALKQSRPRNRHSAFRWNPRTQTHRKIHSWVNLDPKRFVRVGVAVGLLNVYIFTVQ